MTRYQQMKERLETQAGELKQISRDLQIQIKAPVIEFLGCGPENVSLKNGQATVTKNKISVPVTLSVIFYRQTTNDPGFPLDISFDFEISSSRDKDVIHRDMTVSGPFGRFNINWADQRQAFLEAVYAAIDQQIYDHLGTN